MSYAYLSIFEDVVLATPEHSFCPVGAPRFFTMSISDYLHSDANKVTTYRHGKTPRLGIPARRYAAV
jgi:hypothetical protein